MIESGSLRPTYFFLLIVSILSVLLSYFQVQYQFYLWEIFLDTKILLIVVFLLFLWKRNKFHFNVPILKLNKWDLRKNLLWFFFPISIYVVIIFLGLIIGEVEFENVDNAITLVLATAFDIPAIFVFSTTTILIEEIFFRGVLYNSINSEKSQLLTSVTVSLFFSLFYLNEMINFDSFSVLISSSLLLYFFSIGFFASALAVKHNSIWVAYSFRIGLVTLTPLILSSYLVEADSFFKTKNSLFFVEGFLFTIFIFGSGYFLMKSVEKNALPKN